MADAGEKITKQAVDYKVSTDKPRVRCGTCAMFKPPRACSLVQGDISAGAVCAFWETTREGAR